MQPSIVNELLKLFFYHCSHNPGVFVTYFDQSSEIIGYNYRCAENRFTHISVSFRRILGYHEQNILNYGRFISKIVHPQDKEMINQCLKLPNDRSEGQTDPEMITQVKCRAKHMRGYWKYINLYARNYWNEIEKTNDKIGVIFVEQIKFCRGRTANPTGLVNLDDYFPDGSYNNLEFVSPREKEILEMISNGLVTKEIAGQLHISESTVITHRKNLIAKLHVRNTAELIKKATRYMLI